MFLIIFTGAPASGKSSIAATIAQEFNMPYYSKDDFKISLYEQYGFSNHGEKKKLSLLGEKKLMEQIQLSIIQNQDVVVDNNFKDFKGIKEMSEAEDRCKIICINLIANPILLAERYNQRISSGNRHPALYTLDVYPIVEGVSTFHKPIDGNDVLRIQRNVTEETFGDYIFEINTDLIDTQFDLIVTQIKDEIKKYMEA